VTDTIYEYGAVTLNDKKYIQFKQYAGKHVLFVNVASYCDLTAQYPGKNSSFNSFRTSFADRNRPWPNKLNFLLHTPRENYSGEPQSISESVRKDLL
jgi:hypothetical protein